MLPDEIKLNADVEAWWDTNPFAYGISNDERDQVGTIAFEDMDLSYFEEIERKFRKHSHRGAQSKPGEPLFSHLIDYDSISGKDVLDIAVGSGFSMIEFIRQGAKSVTGIDLTSFGVEHAARNLEVRNLSGEIKKMDAQAMTFPDNSFDFACAWGCYMHMPDTKKAIHETYRVLRPRGKVMAYLYNRDSWPFWFNTMLVKGVFMGGLLRYKFNITKLTSRYSDGFSRGGNPLTKFYSKKQVKKMFLDAGFVNVKVVPFALPQEPDNWPFGRYPLFKYLPVSIKRWLSRWGYGAIVTGEKPLSS